MLSIFEYTDPCLFLKDSWQEKKEKNPAFSMRSWAKQFGLKNNSPLSLMLNDERPIPKHYIPVFITSLKLNSREGKYLEALVNYKQVQTIKEKEYYGTILNAMQPKNKLHMQELTSFKYLGNPLCMIILEMTTLKGFVFEDKWIQSHLVENKTLADIRSAMQILLNLELVKNIDGQYVKTFQNITNKQDIVDQGSREYHRRVSQMAIESIENQSVKDRELNGYSFNMHPSKMPAVKERVRVFLNELFAEYESQPQEEGALTYQLNVQLFKASK